MTQVQPIDEPLDLTRWRDAAIAGDLPMPARDRWQPLRAGVVNLWEFEVCEYWFADGRAQLMGRNESGKSTLMALTTLIMLAGDTSAHLIDTIGGSNKRFRYYVEPTQSDDDRRDASKSTSRGWCWAEYGRTTAHGPEFFTTLLYANAKRASERPALTWVICDGPPRVRDGIILIKANAIVQPGDACESASWHTFPSSAPAYRDYLARGLFDTDADRLSGYVRMLKVIRTPKLGAKLNIGFLDEKLREALPPLASHEVSELADGWDELDRIAADRDSAEEARSAVQAYLRQAWQPWAHAEIRKAADAVTTATSDLDDITRRAREAEDALKGADDQLKKLLRSAATTKERRDTAEREAEAIRKTQRYQDAETAVAAAELLGEAAQAARAHADELAEAAAVSTTAAADSAERARVAEGQLASAASGRDIAAAAALEMAAVAGISDAAAWVDRGDVVRLEQAQRERRPQVKEMGSRLAAVDRAGERLEVRQRALDDTVETLSDAQAILVDRATAAAEEAQRVVDGLGSWAVARDPQPGTEQTAAWAESVTATIGAESPTAQLRARVERDFLGPRRSDLTIDRRSELAKTDDARRRASELESEIARLRSQPEPVPTPPAAWTRRTRPQQSTNGAPLWRLLDPLERIADDAVDHIEAALAAAGILDAWVTVDGVWQRDRDGDDLVLRLSPAIDGPSLAEVLTVADDAEGLSSAVDAFLHATAWGIEGEAAVAVDGGGRWRTDTAAGQAAPSPGGASLLGAAARRRGIHRQIEQLTAARLIVQEEVGSAVLRADMLLELLSEIDAAAATLPDDQDLVGHVLAARRAELDVAAAETRVARARREHSEAERAVGDARSSAAEWAAVHALPRDTDELSTLRDALEDLALCAERLRSAVTAHQGAAEHSATAEGEAERTESEAGRATAAVERADSEAKTADARASAAKEALDGETQGLLTRVQNLTSRAAKLANRLEQMQSEREGLLVQRENARTQLDSRTEAATAARIRRDSVTTAWWSLSESGLTGAVGLADAPTRSITGALDGARVARQHVRIADWPSGDVDAQIARIERAWQRLTTESVILRAVLEAGAGRAIRVISRDEDRMARVEIVVDGTGEGYDPPSAVRRLAEQHDELQRSYDDRMHRTLHELLGSTFIEHLRDRLIEVEGLQKRINTILADHPTGTTKTMLRVKRVARDGDPDAAGVLAALEESSYQLLSPESQQEVRFFLQTRIGEAREAARAAADADWRGRLADALDYRAWFAWSIEKRSGEGGRWTPLTSGSHGKLSGGASVVTLMLPLVATLAAMYEIAPLGPRPVWLDEAFDGVDSENRSSVLGLLRDFDMDYLLAGPVLLVKAPTVPAAAIWEVVRAEHPLPGADLELMLWAAGDLSMINLPDPAKVAAQSAAKSAAP